MFKKLLIANRGEIASRIIRTAKRMGIGTVAVHSEADTRALHVQQADEHVAIGPAAERDSYLKIEHILAAAQDTGCDAVHPGYGFLSENAAFAAACRDAGLVFVGPSTQTIEQLGTRPGARAHAVAAGLAVIPGSDVLDSVEAACAAARELGYPVLLKPVVGGGGLGMARADSEAQLRACYDQVRRAASQLFDVDAVYLEKLVAHPRHIEVQIAADAHGHLVHLGERECSIQRRHQKIAEEAPSPGLDPELRRAMIDAALHLAQHVGYTGLGTVEMLVQKRQAHFLEMNTRLQVEHPVTEMTTGIDLVEWQIRIALGEPLPAAQAEIDISGHAMQCRIYAEDPADNFAPAPGYIESFVVPTGPGIRNDVGVQEGDYVTPYYDPLIAKLVAAGRDRRQALARLRTALEDYEVTGVKTNLGVHRQVVAQPAFVAGELSTDFLSQLPVEA